MKISITMPCINLWAKYTKDAIESCDTAMMRAKEHGIDSRFLLIDNASTDETKTEAPKKESELFVYQRNDRQWGFQESVNFGFLNGFTWGADVVLVLNNDIVLHPDALWRLAERFSKGGVGMVTCADMRGEIEQKGLLPHAIGQLASQDKEGVEEAPHPCFSAFAVNRECLEVVGFMDEVFAPAYFEDNDYHYRMKLADVPAIVYPPAMFYHYGSRTQNEALPQPVVSSGAFENNRATYVRKWGGVPGQEKFTTPYNDPANKIDDCKQALSTP